ncbi:MAG: tRNA epoxyqueuosine(34) reductase QueG [Candidatus Baltobacteraceae bacterium]
MMDRWRASELEAIKRRIRDLAVSLGASAVRVARADADHQTARTMKAAFARKDFETWPYGEAYARTASDPSHILEGAQAVICIAVPYRMPVPRPTLLQGRVSNYAWPVDYHRRIQAMLRELAQRIDECAGGPVCAVACDTKPLAERAFAAQAGLGWIGKHTNLISPAAGSFVFLGEVVTTLPLQADPPLRKTCGSCARCVPACPTRALRGDYTIDAVKCISDLTQRTDAIPRDMRALIGTWIWGCDICQEVCPPNERVLPPIETAPPASSAAAAPQLVELLKLRSGEFKRTFAPTAMGWRGAAVLRRNAAVALGNALDRSTVPALVSSLQADPHPMVRGHAAWALGRIGSAAAIGALQAGARSEDDASVREEIRAALEPFPAGRALHPV